MDCGNISTQRKVALESCAAASATSDLQKLSTAMVDTKDYKEDDESSAEEEDNKEFADPTPVDDGAHQALKFTMYDKAN